MKITDSSITDSSIMVGGKYNGFKLGGIPDNYWKALYASYKAGVYAAYIEKRFPKLKEMLATKPQLRNKLAPKSRASFAR